MTSRPYVTIAFDPAEGGDDVADRVVQDLEARCLAVGVKHVQRVRDSKSSGTKSGFGETLKLAIELAPYAALAKEILGVVTSSMKRRLVSKTTFIFGEQTLEFDGPLTVEQQQTIEFLIRDHQENSGDGVADA